MRMHSLTVHRLIAFCLPQSVLTLFYEWEWQRLRRRAVEGITENGYGGSDEVMTAGEAPWDVSSSHATGRDLTEALAA